MNPSVIIVGGGVIGLSLAWELTSRGCKVTIIDQGKFGRGTSWTAAGILPPANFQASTDPIDRLRGFSHNLFPQWSQRLFDQTSIDIGLRHCGGWYLADSPGERALMAGMTHYWDELSIQCDSVSPRELASREPALAAWVARTTGADKVDLAAWWVPDEFQVRPPRLIQALAKACDRNGVIKREHQCVIDIDDRGDQAIVTLDCGLEIKADRLVLCSGVWTGRIASQLNLDAAIIPVRGQILLLKTHQPLIKSVVNLGNRYLIARDDGHTLIGSCEEEVGFNTDTDESMLDQLFEFATELVPPLAGAQRVTAWSGLRPMTFDGFPMIGKVPGQPQTYIAAGHYRSGVHLAPGTAVVMADTLLGNEPAINLEPFRIGKQQSHTN